MSIATVAAPTPSGLIMGPRSSLIWRCGRSGAGPMGATRRHAEVWVRSTVRKGTANGRCAMSTGRPVDGRRIVSRALPECPVEDPLSDARSKRHRSVDVTARWRLLRTGRAGVAHGRPRPRPVRHTCSGSINCADRESGLPRWGGVWCASPRSPEDTFKAIWRRRGIPGNARSDSSECALSQ